MGGALGAAVAILLWWSERVRETEREKKAFYLRWEQNKHWVLISLDEVRAEFDTEIEVIRQHKMSTNALIDIPESLSLAADSDLGLIEYRNGIRDLITFADETRRLLPPLQAEYVSWYGYDWCREYSRLDAAVRNFRQILSTIALPDLALEPVQQLNGVLNRAAAAGNVIDDQFEDVTSKLRGITQ